MFFAFVFLKMKTYCFQLSFQNCDDVITDNKTKNKNNIKNQKIFFFIEGEIKDM
jgi:hypothetical protein